jgi:hypothetical protein
VFTEATLPRPSGCSKHICCHAGGSRLDACQGA